MIRGAFLEDVGTGRRMPLDLLDLLSARIALDREGAHESAVALFEEHGAREIHVDTENCRGLASALRASPWSPYVEWGTRVLFAELIARFLEQCEHGCRIVHYTASPT